MDDTSGIGEARTPHNGSAARAQRNGECMNGVSGTLAPQQDEAWRLTAAKDRSPRDGGSHKGAGRSVQTFIFKTDQLEAFAQRSR